jgi:hypothetical protein
MDPAAFDGATLSSDPSDSDDIRWALETASAMWTKGDHHEALRWLRRAAETASEEGADTRAVELAKVAAELRSRINVTEIPPQVAPQEAAPAGGNGHAESGASSALRTPDSNHSRDEVFERAAQTLLNAEAPIGAAWSSAEERSDPALVPAPIQPVGSGAALDPEPPARKSVPHKPPSSPASFARRSSTPPPSPALKAPSPTRMSAPPSPRSRTPVSTPAVRPMATHQAVRVAILSSPEKGVLMARVLAAGEHAPAGAKEALFVALEPGVDLIGPY